MKIGILGGTFNPIHLGHLILAEEVREKIGLDKIIFVPANSPPHKNYRDIASAKMRFEMARIALKNNRYFSVSDIEIKRPGKSYTIDTLRCLRRKYPKESLYFITGSDLLTYLNEWKDLSEIIKMVKFIVATRPGYPLAKIRLRSMGALKGLVSVAIRAVDISAFEIRQAIKANKSFRYLVPEAVFKYILKNKLYR